MAAMSQLSVYCHAQAFFTCITRPAQRLSSGLTLALNYQCLKHCPATAWLAVGIPLMTYNNRAALLLFRLHLVKTSVKTFQVSAELENLLGRQLVAHCSKSYGSGSTVRCMAAH